MITALERRGRLIASGKGMVPHGIDGGLGGVFGECSPFTTNVRHHIESFAVAATDTGRPEP